MLIGIDLGTTNSLVAVMRDGKPHLIPNALGDTLTPSAISLSEDNTVLVGRAARDRALTHPAQSAMAFKRFMGTNRITRLGNKNFRAEELSSLVLRALKEDAERFLGETVTEAVITVPAYFNDAQRQATRIAGELAGLSVRRLINEPTAAALAYGLMEAPPESTFLILDLGGGTFDVSILERFDGVMEVRASTGDNFLGGEDFVEALIAHMAQRFPALNQRQAEPALQAKLWREGERVKRLLGQRDEVEFSVEWQGTSFTESVSAEHFERLVQPLLKRIRQPIERALRDAKIQAMDLDQIVLAGGATRMPLVRQLVARMFGRMPSMNLNPDEVIARGAAVMVGLIERDAALEEMVMTDVCPYSLGVSISKRLEDGSRRNGFFSPIIERNSAVPISREESYFTSADYQTDIELEIYQGEARLVKDNILLGELNIPVPAMKAGEVEIRVRFTYDISGLLEVEAHVPQTDRRERLLLEKSPGALSDEEIAKRLEKLAALKIHPRDEQINIAALAQAERLHEELLGRERLLLGETILAFEQAINAQDPAQIERQRLALERALIAFSRDTGL